MTDKREEYLRKLIRSLVEEQSQGEWTPKIIDEDTNMLFEALKNEFCDASGCQ